MTTTKLTQKETEALVELVFAALNETGSETYDDLLNDMFTWCEPSDLVGKTRFDFTLTQARGVFASLEVKGMIEKDEGDWAVTEAGVKWMRDNEE